MKKFLALVLALVMNMSLVTISAGAEDCTDAASMTSVTDLIADFAVIKIAGTDTVKYLAEDVEIYLAEVESGVYTLTETTLAKNDVVNFYVVGGTGTDANDIAFVLVTRAE